MLLARLKGGQTNGTGWGFTRDEWIAAYAQVLPRPRAQEYVDGWFRLQAQSGEAGAWSGVTFWPASLALLAAVSTDSLTGPV